MATKTKKKTSSKKNVTAQKIAVPAIPALDPCKMLLAQVAGTVAAGLVTAPSPLISTPSSMATAAVDIAAEILKKAGITELSAEAAFSEDSAVGAAS